MSAGETGSLQPLGSHAVTQGLTRIRTPTAHRLRSGTCVVPEGSAAASADCRQTSKGRPRGLTVASVLLSFPLRVTTYLVLFRNALRDIILFYSLKCISFPLNVRKPH